MSNLNRGFSRGFTLVELVLVMTIAGVLAAVMGPRMVDRTAFQTHGSTAEIRTALRYAQKLALAKNREVCVVAAVPSTLTLRFNSTPVLGAACNAAVSRLGENTPYTVTVPANIGLASVPVTAFRFNGQGQPTSNSAVPLNTSVTLTVGGGTQVTVERDTGYVH
ncbi:MAG: prepilin-type N-terminal cleavage/methylation domain-containing protein [Thiobacillus sp.]|nr:prepilin-type N-terminal cleavage/methylation domain-containing protein [Thiobacillus sp.]MDP1926627.1 prepilin-type N-terminal cleavage/methylation domain-containing protein [Thiobacillus sp.]